MATIHTIQGRPFRRDGNDLWSSSGSYVGRFRGDQVFSSSGAYLGELKDGRLGYRIDQSNKRGGSMAGRTNRTGMSASSRTAKSMPIGWEEFHG